MRSAFPPCGWPWNTFRNRAGLACKPACRRSALRAVFPRSPSGRTCAFALFALRLASERFWRPRGVCLQTGLPPFSASGGLSAFAIRPYLCVWPSRLATGLGTLSAARQGLPANRSAAVQRFGRSFRVRHSAVPVRLAFPPCDWPRNAFRDRAGLACKPVCRRSALRAIFCVRRPAVPVRLAFPPRGLTSECFSPPRGACLQTGLPLSASGGLLRAHGCLACVCGTRLQLRQQPQRRCRHVSHAGRGISRRQIDIRPPRQNRGTFPPFAAVFPQQNHAASRPAGPSCPFPALCASGPACRLFP